MNDIQAFHVVLTTHCSRTSQRMIDFKVKKREPLELTFSQEIILTKIISNIILEKKYKCIAYNICKDHVHLIIFCDYTKLSEIIKYIKGKSSYLFKRSAGNEGIEKVWSQKFFRADLDIWKPSSVSNKPGYVYKDTHLENAIAYIKTNRAKHDLPSSTLLQDIIQTFVLDNEEAFL